MNRKPRCPMSRLAALAAGSCLAALLAAALPAGAQEAIDRTLPLASGGKLEVRELISGSVKVVGWDRAEVRIAGTLGREIEEMFVDAAADRVEIEFEYRKGSHHHRPGEEDTRLEIHAPAGANVSIGTISADIDASGLEGEIDLASVSGNLTVSAAPKSASLESISGSIEAALEAGEIDAQTVSGDIAVTGRAPMLKVESVSGDIEIRGGPYPDARGETVSGDVEFLAPLAPDGEYDFTSHSGDITLVVAEGTSAEFELSTFSGDLDVTDFEKAPASSKSRRRMMDDLGREMRFTLGDGGADVEATTFSGDVIVRRP